MLLRIGNSSKKRWFYFDLDADLIKPLIAFEHGELPEVMIVGAGVLNIEIGSIKNVIYILQRLIWNKYLYFLHSIFDLG